MKDNDRRLGDASGAAAAPADTSADFFEQLISDLYKSHPKDPVYSIAVGNLQGLILGYSESVTFSREQVEVLLSGESGLYGHTCRLLSDNQLKAMRDFLANKSDDEVNVYFEKNDKNAEPVHADENDDGLVATAAFDADEPDPNDELEAVVAKRFFNPHGDEDVPPTAGFYADEPDPNDEPEVAAAPPSDLGEGEEYNRPEDIAQLRAYIKRVTSNQSGFFQIDNLSLSVALKLLDVANANHNLSKPEFSLEELSKLLNDTILKGMAKSCLGTIMTARLEAELDKQLLQSRDPANCKIAVYFNHENKLEIEVVESAIAAQPARTV